MISSKVRVRIFSATVIVYMVAALSWWAILLARKTTTIHKLKMENVELYPNSEKEYIRQHRMIAGEAFVFAGSLIIGILLLNKAFRNEMVAVKQQKNFLLSVTHELKSPITAIQLILDTFKKRKLESQQFNHLLEDAKEEAGRLNKLVEDLLSAARLNPKSTLKREIVDLKQLIDPLVTQFQRNHPDHQFIFEKNEEKFLAYTNEASLYLIISNLLDNAVKYSDLDTEVFLRLRKKSGQITLSVEDSGRGIPEHEKSRIFDQFYRIGDEDVRSSTGTGLGLYLVSELCTKLNIKIEVKDNHPVGSVFQLQVPVKK